MAALIYLQYLGYVYNFWKSLKEKETTNQRGYLLRKLALNSFGSGWKVIKQKHEFEDLKVTFWDTDIHSLFTSVHILLLTIELESKMGCKKSTIFFSNLAYTSHIMYSIVASTSPSRFEAHAGHFRLLMKGIFDAYVLWPFDKKSFFELVTRVNTRDFTVCVINDNKHS